jgi:hypothetical protein
MNARAEAIEWSLIRWENAFREALYCTAGPEGRDAVEQELREARGELAEVLSQENT